MDAVSFMSSLEQDAAYNEAGHAVARYVLYGMTGRVELLDKGDKAGRSEVPVLPDSLLDGTRPKPKDVYTVEEENAIDDYIVTTLAGPLAEARLSPKMFHEALSHSDEAHSYGIARAYWKPSEGEERVGQLMPRADRIVEDNLTKVEHVSNELLEHRALSPEDVRRIIEEG